MQFCFADNDRRQIRGAVVRARGGHPGLHHQRPPSHAEDHPLVLSHEGRAERHGRRYWLLLHSPSTPSLHPPSSVPPASAGCLTCFYLTFLWLQKAEREGRGEGCEGKPELKLKDSLGKTGGWYSKRSESWEANGQKKGEGMIWIWVKCCGNSQGEMISTENVWLGLTKKDISVFGVLLCHPAFLQLW